MNRNDDVWDEFAAFLAEMMEKYAAKIDLDSLPDPPRPYKDKTKSAEIENKPGKGKSKTAHDHVNAL